MPIRLELGPKDMAKAQVPHVLALSHTRFILLSLLMSLSPSPVSSSGPRTLPTLRSKQSESDHCHLMLQTTPLPRENMLKSERFHVALFVS